jgi:hypothetical protein
MVDHLPLLYKHNLVFDGLLPAGFLGGFTTRGAQRGIKHAAKSALIPGNEIICVGTKNQTS